MDITKMTAIYFAPYNWYKRRSIRKYNIWRVKSFCSKDAKLNKKQIEQARQFYSPYCNITPLFHSFYFEKTSIFCEQHLPTDIYINYVDEYFNDRVAAKKMDNKCLYPILFPGIPQADNIAFRKNNFWFNNNDEMLSQSALADILNAEPAVFVKMATNSAGGKGVHYLDSGKQSLYTQLMDIMSSTKEDIVIQRPLKQHAALAAINASSVNTIRVISLLSKNGVKCYSTILRMGIDGSKVDNASSGGITCGITPEGKLKKTAYKPSGEKYDVHPTSGVVFEGYTIPGIKEVWETVNRAHKKFPHFRLVSWDFAIDTDGHPVMIEANLNLGELDFHQLNNGPLFGDDTKMILDEVFGKNKE